MEPTAEMDLRTFFRAAAASAPLSNTAIRAAYATYQSDTLKKHVATLRRDNPKLDASWTDDDVVRLYWAAVSCFQSKAGKFLEKYVEDALTAARIPFKAQVRINSNGIIVATRGRGCKIPDIVFGNPIVGTHISQYAVLSLKTSSRERSALDTAWTFEHPPKCFYYGTLDDDYPDAETFHEGPTRKLVCATPRDGDTRQFRLGFEHLIDELRGLGYSEPPSL